MPPTSHPIRIKIYSIDNSLLKGATVTLTLSTYDPLEETSNSDGEVVFNVANAGDWNVGDSVTLVATKTGDGTKESTLVLTSSPQTTSLTLAQTSDFNYEENDMNVYQLNFAMLVDFQGNKITQGNRLPVSSETTLSEPALTNTYDSKNRLSTQTITVKGTQYRRTFTYTGTAFQFTSRSAWEEI